MRRVWIVAVLTIILATNSSFADGLNESERLPFADGLYARGLYELALKEYETFLTDCPNSPSVAVAQFRMGECYRGLGRFADAEREYKAVYAGSTNSEVRFKAGFKQATLAMEQGQDAVAIGLFQTLLREKLPDEMAAASLYDLGGIFQKNSNTVEAARAFEQVKDQYQSTTLYSYALLKLGDIYSRDKVRQDQALEMYRLAVEKPATNRVAAEALFQIGVIEFSRKAFDKSANAYGRLISQYPADERAAEGRFQAGWACHNAGLYVEGLALADGALKGNADEKKPEWLYLKANCERQLMKNDEAIQTYTSLLDQYPGGSLANAALYEKALAYYKMGKYQEAVREAGKINQTPELKKDVCWLLAESYAALKQTDFAIQYYRIITKEFPKSDVACDAAYRLAHHLQGKGDYQEASRGYNTVAADFPDGKLAPKALFAAAYCNVSANRHEDALRDWAALIQKYPADPLVEESLYQKAITEIRLKRYSEAMVSLRDLLKKFPASAFAPDAHYWLGVLLNEDKKPQESETELREAVKNNVGKAWAKEAEFRLAMVLQKNGKQDEAAVLLQSLLSSPARENFSPELLEWLAEYKFDKRQFKESVEAAQILVERHKEADWQQIGLCLLGRARLAQGDKAGAEDAYRKAAAIDAKTRLLPESALRLGELTLGGTNNADSVKFFSQAASLSTDEKLLGVRARAYVGLGRVAKATSDFESAARYFMSVAVLYDDPDVVPECLFEAAAAYQKLGNADAGKKALQELKERYPQSDWAKRVQ